jgi:aryl-alcohol dehydrogenase-like predicted oxidoreductase
MIPRPLGESGMGVTPVGLGAWGIGGWKWGGVDEESAIQSIQAAVGSGMNIIDTAPIYGMGVSEEIVGKGLKGIRRKVVLATKCGLVWHVKRGEYFFDQREKPVYKYLRSDSLWYEIEQSLRRLKTDYVDLYQTHWQDATTPIGATMETLMEMKEQGTIRAIGVCNVTVAQVEEYRKIGPVDSVQQKFSMLDREMEKELLPYCRENKIAVLAYSPLAYGLLTGKIGPETEFEGDDLRKQNPRFSPENIAKVRAMLDRFGPIARKHDCAMAQLVIAWTAAQKGITTVLCGSRHAEYSLENAKAGDISLEQEDLEMMQDIISEFASELP